MRFTIDTSVFVSRLSETEEAHDASRRFLQALPGRPVMIVLPTLVSPEISGSIGRLTGDATLAHDALRLLDLLPNLNLIALDERLAAEAAAMAAAVGMKGSDAVFAAVALRFEAVLVSLDKVQLERSPASVTAVTPGEALIGVDAIA